MTLFKYPHWKGEGNIIIERVGVFFYHKEARRVEIYFIGSGVGIEEVKECDLKLHGESAERFIEFMNSSGDN